MNTHTHFIHFMHAFSSNVCHGEANLVSPATQNFKMQLSFQRCSTKFSKNPPTISSPLRWLLHMLQNRIGPPIIPNKNNNYKTIQYINQKPFEGYCMYSLTAKIFKIADAYQVCFAMVPFVFLTPASQQLLDK